MALTGSWGWTNNTPATNSLIPTLIDTVHDYTEVDKIGDYTVPKEHSHLVILPLLMMVMSTLFIKCETFLR
jgi:hypothetical protein